MEQSGGQPRKPIRQEGNPSRRGPAVYGIVGLSAFSIGVFAAMLGVVEAFQHGTSHNTATSVCLTIGLVAGMAGVLTFAYSRDLSNTTEVQARQRVRQAEDKLSNELRQPLSFDLYIPNIISKDLQAVHTGVHDVEPVDANNGTRTTAAPVEVPAVERRDDRLTLAALWDVTHGRMDLYHQIVTRQAKRSFGAAQVAMGVGFVLLVVFAVLAAEAKTTAAAIGAGGLGAVGAAFAAYIGKTFIRSQESAASHLRAYFDQPLELSRYLAAERLLADAKELSAEQRAAILTSLVQSIATAGHDDTPKDDKHRAARGRARG
jgi:hypothetical protein